MKIKDMPSETKLAIDNLNCEAIGECESCPIAIRDEGLIRDYYCPCLLVFNKKYKNISIDMRKMNKYLKTGKVTPKKALHKTGPFQRRTKEGD